MLSVAQSVESASLMLAAASLLLSDNQVRFAQNNAFTEQEVSHAPEPYTREAYIELTPTPLDQRPGKPNVQLYSVPLSSQHKAHPITARETPT